MSTGDEIDRMIRVTISLGSLSSGDATFMLTKCETIDRNLDSVERCLRWGMPSIYTSTRRKVCSANTNILLDINGSSNYPVKANSCQWYRAMFAGR